MGRLFTSRLFAGLIRNCLIGLLVFGTVACGASAPRSVVDSALQFEIAQAKTVPNTLVGIKLLEDWSQVRSVKVQTQQSVTVHVDETTYPGLDVRGTYTLEIHTPGRASKYKRTSPFALTLVHEVDPEVDRGRWLLARPQAALQPNVTNSTSSNWTLIDFLPAPEPPEVSSPPTGTDASLNSNDGASTIPSSLSAPSQLSSEETSNIVETFEALGQELDE